jgi:purine-nucleoside/S-methyl-5'-thioadenosine phosphorylase / adenosine deaminase
VPGWARVSLSGAEILFSDRTGGVSAPPFDTANAGYSRGDDPAAVAENRRRIGAGLGGRAIDPRAWTCLHQVHGADVHEAGSHIARGLPPADASVSADPAAVLAILTADCAPVALVGPGVVGAVHAGWRGLAAGVVEAAVERMTEMAGEAPAAVVGPCIHPCCY